jgi:Protein of unknown function (DUF2934)
MKRPGNWVPLSPEAAELLFQGAALIEEMKRGIRMKRERFKMRDNYLPTKEQIQQRAYELYLERGGEDGHDLRDWLAAEAELMEVAELAELSEQAPSIVTKARAAVVGATSPTAAKNAQEVLQD